MKVIAAVSLVWLLAGTACSQSSGEGSAESPSAPAQSGKPESQAMSDVTAPDRVRLQQLATEMNAWRVEVEAAGASGLPGQAAVDAHKQKLNAYYQELQTVPQVLDETSADADVLAARKAYQDLRASLSEAYQQAQAQPAAPADPQATLASIDAALQAHGLPQQPYEPYDKAMMESWMTSAAETRRIAEQSLSQLNRIAAQGGLTGTNSGQSYDLKDVRRMQNYAGTLVRRVDEQYEAVWKAMSDALVGLERDVPTYRPPYAQELLQTARAKAETAKFLADALGRDAGRARNVLQLIATQEANLAAATGSALEGMHLPEPASKDKARLKIAKDIIERPKYGFGAHGPIVLITKDISEHERKDKQFDVEDTDVSLNGDVTLTGTETTWTYKWQEFKFVTPVQDEDTGSWYVWTITARKFSSGGNRTPIGKWVSGKAVKGPQILEKNF